MQTTYSVLILLGLSIIGIICHVLSDIAKAQQNKTYISLKAYLSSTWAAILFSLFLCIGFILIRHEFMQIPDYTKWEGLCMMLAGYSGRSALIPILRALEKKGVKLDDTPTTLLLVVYNILTIWIR